MAENKSAFIRVLGGAPYIRVLDFLLSEGRILDYTLTDISKHTNVSWSTLHLVWPAFLQLGIVVKTRTVGRSKLYKLNVESPLVTTLIKCDFLLSKFMMDVKRGRLTLDENAEHLIKKEFKEAEKTFA